MKCMIVGKVIKLERLNNSVWGNPRYSVTIKDEADNYFYAKTASEASCAYSIGNNYGKKKLFHYHVTKAGNNIIDYIDLMA